MSLNKLIFFSIVLLVGISCWQGKGKNIPDVSDIKVSLDIKDFHQQLFSIDTNDITTGISGLQANFPEFFDLYFTRILPFRKKKELDENFYLNVQGFLTDERIQKLVDTTNIVYNDFSDLEKDFKQAFQYLKYYFPNKNIPELYPLISEFGFATFIFPINENKDGLGIGLDMFLGDDYPYWRLAQQNPAFSAYLTRTFNKEHLVKKSMDAVIDDMIPMVEGDRLLDMMIYNGKKMCILDRLLPLAPDSIKWEYTTQQMDWVKANEQNIYWQLLKEELIYETSLKKIKKLVDKSPNAPGMPPEAPGGTANYIGWKIIEAYLKRHPDTNLETLLQMDSQKILDASKYKPL